MASDSFGPSKSTVNLSNSTPAIPNGQQSTGPPPAYTSVVRKVYPYSLRPIAIFMSVVGFIYGLALGVQLVKDRNDDDETSKESIYDLIQAILLFVVALVELFCLAVAVLRNLKLARMFMVAVPLGVMANLGASVLSVVEHFTLKTDLIEACTSESTGEDYSEGWDTYSNVTNTEAESLCTSSWNRGTWGVFAWLFVTLILSLIFASTLLGFYQQLLDPSSVRERRPRGIIGQGNSYPMQPGYYPPPPQNGQQDWMVPPYPGLPAGYSSYPPPPPHGYEKSDYHPDAAWAQGEYPPSGNLPHGSNARDVGENHEEDEAWERAETQGVTAHLTGHGSAPGRETERERGYVVSNTEEDEAWERARDEGVTAHLTGAPAGRDRERAV